MEIGFVGWRQFLSERKWMLDAFDRAKEQQADKPVQIEHGPVAEAEFRRWLRAFLPRRYGVTSGFIIPEEEDDVPLRHFDVLVFDELESPVLWVEDDADKSSQGSKQAIPAEYVRAVFEVKSRLTRTSLRDAITKLTELTAFRYLATNIGGRNKNITQFFCAPTFFEFSTGDSPSVQALAALHEMPHVIHMLRAVVFRNNDGDVNHTGRFMFLVGDGVVDDQKPTVRVHPTYDPFVHRLQDVTEVRIMWSPHQFQMFAFEVFDRLAGKSCIIDSSYYAMPPMIEL
jgi:hypothetical protein